MWEEGSTGRSEKVSAAESLWGLTWSKYLFLIMIWWCSKFNAWYFYGNFRFRSYVPRTANNHEHKSNKQYAADLLIISLSLLTIHKPNYQKFYTYFIIYVIVKQQIKKVYSGLLNFHLLWLLFIVFVRFLSLEHFFFFIKLSLISSGVFLCDIDSEKNAFSFLPLNNLF